MKKNEAREKVGVYMDVGRLMRVSEKIFLVLHKKTRNHFEAYAVVLLLKKFLESECGLIESEFDPIIAQALTPVE